MDKLHYKGKGEHSVIELELIIEQQAEELHLLNSGQKQLNMHDVSQRSELLLAYEEYKHSDIYNLADGYEDVIERFIANNCG